MQIGGSTAIITGASSGIGREVAREFAQRGANVVLASRSRDALERLASELISLPGRILVAPTDVTERLSVEALVRRTTEEFGGFEILINNAGVGLFAPIAEGNPDNARYMFDVNFWGSVNCIQAAVPYLKDAGQGHIVNVSSIAGHISPPYMGMYSATKHALAAVSDALRVELAGTGIGVSSVFPGLTETSFTQNMLQEVEAPEIPPIVRWTPADLVALRIYQAVRWNIRDVYIQPEDVAAVIADLTIPQILDFGMRFFMRPGPRQDVHFRRPVGQRQLPDAAE